MTLKIVERAVPPAAQATLLQAGVHPVLARLYAARGIDSAGELEQDLAGLLAPSTMAGIELASARLADSLAQPGMFRQVLRHQRLVV